MHKQPLTPEQARQAAQQESIRKSWSSAFGILGANASYRAACQELSTLPASERHDYVLKTWGQAGLDKVASILHRIEQLEREAVS